jgi:putative ABC transport system permease protein
MFTAVAVVSLALGIGLNTAIFNVINALLLQSAPVAQPARLVALFHSDRSSGGLEGLGPPDYESYRDSSASFESLAAHSSMDFSVRMGSVTESVLGELVSDNYFSTLGIHALLGRTFAPDSQGIVLSYGFWQRRLGGDPAIASKTLTVAGTALPILGVARRNFRGLQLDLSEPPNIWVPFSLHKLAAPSWTDGGRGMHWFDCVARLKPGVTLAAAEAEVSTISSRLARDYPDTNADLRAKLFPLRVTRGLVLNNPLVSTLAVLSVVAGVVLLITCANLANLLLARGWKRRPEMVLRVSLGATRARLLAQLSTESLLLAILGGAAGLMVTVWASALLSRFYLPFRSAAEATLDTRVLLFAVVVSLLTGILFGIAPARQASRIDLSSALKADPSAARGPFGVRNVLVAMQVALSLVLLIGAGLFVATLRNARSSDVTFGTSNVLLVHVDLPTQRYSLERTKQFWPRLLDAARRLPGVTSASLVFVVPHAGTRGGTDVVFNQQPIQVDFNIAAPQYFQTIGIPLVRGRDFNDRDDAGAPPRAVVNEQFASRFWPGEDPIGKTFRIAQPSALVEVIGVVRDGKFRGFRADIQPCFYRPLYQQTVPVLTLEIRTAGSVTALVPALRQVVAKLDPDLPLKDVRTWQEHVARSMARENMLATLLSGFGMLALLLASTGTYGVVSFAVAQRTREMGIRIALGATRTNILRNVLGGMLLPVAAGIVVGTAGALLLTRFVKNMLYDISTTDVAVFSAVIAIELAVALLAAYLPGRRATNVDPMTALRHE